jgi:hypothetical protein
MYLSRELDIYADLQKSFFVLSFYKGKHDENNKTA